MQQEETQVIDEADLEEQAFLAELSGEKPDVQAPEETTPEVQEEAAPEAEEVKEERVEVIPGYTAEEVKATLAKLQKSVDTTAGTLGSRLAEQQKLIDELKAQKAEQDKQVLQVQAQAAELSPDQLSGLKEQFPELAEILAKDLSKIIKPQSAPDLAPIEQKYEQRYDELRQAMNQEKVQMGRQMLEWMHPDWQDVASYGQNEQGLIQFKDSKFHNWLLTQTEDVQQEVINGENAFRIAKHISSYKESLKPKEEEVRQQKKTNLEKSLQPKGIPVTHSHASLDEEEEAFLAELQRGR